MPSQQGQLQASYLEYLQSSGLDRAFADHAPKTPPDPYAHGAFDPKIAQADIRWLEQSRGYATWETVGTEPQGVYLARLATVRQRKGPFLGDRLPHLQPVLDGQARALFDAAHRLGVSFPFDIFVGLYPTGEFNAHVQPVAGGALLLVNAGLMDLLFCVLKANLAASGSDQDPPLLKDRQTAMVLAETFNAYLYGDGSLLAWPLPRLDSNRESFLGFVLRAGELFVIAHELGHIACGHVRLPQRSGAQAEVQLTPETELEADAFAVDLLVRGSGFAEDERPAAFLAGGILNILSIAFEVSALADRFRLEQASAGTHPALTERWARLETLLKQRIPTGKVEKRGEMFRGWLTIKYLAPIEEWFDRVNEEMTRPSKY
ncbi:MAG: ImmA/IrrE family metallo-endopeptidase [Candidatus Dormibacteraeota bacterium]|nr:ImmA/IrrE family metallo-endopeptidase [Candidatus Dormibacteraeota bacterium]